VGALFLRFFRQNSGLAEELDELGLDIPAAFRRWH